MSGRSRPVAFWVFTVFIALSIVLMLAGQTMSLFDYDLTVRLGLQESLEEVGEVGVQVNRAFGVGDTVVYVPLLIASLLGLSLKKRWSLTVASILLFAPGAHDYSYVPGPEIWIFVAAYAVFGFWGLAYLIARGERLITSPGS